MLGRFRWYGVDIDRTIGILGVILALPGFFFQFVNKNATIALLSFALASVCILGALAIRYLTRRPKFHLHDATVQLEIFDADGHEAHLSKQYHIEANYDDLQTMTHRNIAADGDITNIYWNDRPVPDESIEQTLGEHVVTADLAMPRGRGDKFQGKLSYDLTDSFPDRREELRYNVDFPTKQASLQVFLPEDRPARGVNAYRLDGAGRVPIESPQVSDNGELIEMELSRPQLGDEYSITWVW